MRKTYNLPAKIIVAVLLGSLVVLGWGMVCKSIPVMVIGGGLYVLCYVAAVINSSIK